MSRLVKEDQREASSLLRRAMTREQWRSEDRLGTRDQGVAKNWVD